MKTNKQMKLSTKSFLLTFFCTLILFGIIAIIATGAIKNAIGSDDKDAKKTVETQKKKKKNTTENSAEAMAEDEIEGESFSVLIAGYGVEKDSFDAMAIVDVNKEDKTVSIYPVNTDAKVYVGYGSSSSVNVRLGDLCKYRSLDYIKGKVEAVTAVKIDYYLSLTADGFISAVDTLNKGGKYSYKVPKNMEHFFSSEEELKKYNISFNNGQKITKGIEFYNVLRFEDDSTAERLERQSEIAEGMIKSIVVPSMSSDISGSVKTFLNLIKIMTECQTDIPVENFISESYELLTLIPEFTFQTNTKFKGTTVNFK